MNRKKKRIIVKSKLKIMLMQIIFRVIMMKFRNKMIRKMLLMRAVRHRIQLQNKYSDLLLIEEIFAFINDSSQGDFVLP